MELHSEIWGHISLATPATTAMELAEEANELAMLRCRHRKISIAPKPSLYGFAPSTDAVIFNPNTLFDIASIFETNVEKAFADG